MIIYKDAFSGDEMFSDAFEVRTVDDIVYEVDGATSIMKQGVDIDIGANPSAEEIEEGLEEGSKNVINVVYNFRLQQTQFDNKKSFLTYLKGYMKKVKAHLQENQPDRVDAFEIRAQAFAKRIVANFKDYEFYTGESMDPEAMVVLLNYREDGVTPYFTYWKDGLKIEKV